MDLVKTFNFSTRMEISPRSVFTTFPQAWTKPPSAQLKFAYPEWFLDWRWWSPLAAEKVESCPWNPANAFGNASALFAPRHQTPRHLIAPSCPAKSLRGSTSPGGFDGCGMVRIEPQRPDEAAFPIRTCLISVSARLTRPRFYGCSNLRGTCRAAREGCGRPSPTKRRRAHLAKLMNRPAAVAWTPLNEVAHRKNLKNLSPIPVPARTSPK